jgi:hypothetical protein
MNLNGTVLNKNTESKKLKKKAIYKYFLIVLFKKKLPELNNDMRYFNYFNCAASEGSIRCRKLIVFINI